MFLKKNKNTFNQLSFLIFILVFVYLNAYRLNFPYFWDELACYFRSSHYLYHHQLSIFPSAVPSDISYDHPLLIQNIVAILLHLFKNSPFVVHLFFLVISCFFIFIMYQLALKLEFKNLSVISIVLITIQPVFIAQSQLFQLEMTFSLLCFLSLYFYSNKNFKLYFFIASLNILVKESAIVIPASLFIYEILSKISFKEKIKFKIIQFYPLIPLLMFILFMLMTKMDKGYYLSPINSGKTSFYLDVFKQRLIYCLNFVFIEQGRIIFSVFFFILITYIILIKKESKKLGQLMTLPFNYQSLVFLALFLIFSAINNPLERYLLVMLPLIYFIFLQILIQYLNVKINFLIISVFIVISFFNMKSKNRFTDSDLSYVSHIKSMDSLKNYLYQNQLIDKVIKSDWPIIFSLQNDEFGLVKEKHNSVFLMNEDIKMKTELYIFTLPGNLDEKTVPDSFNLIKNIEVEYAKCQIWTKK